MILVSFAYEASVHQGPHKSVRVFSFEQVRQVEEMEEEEEEALGAAAASVGRVTRDKHAVRDERVSNLNRNHHDHVYDNNLPP